MKAFILALVAASSVMAGQPLPHVLRVAIAPYPIPSGVSNAVITVYRSTSLGTVWTPFKPTAIFPATRTNTFITVLPGTYRFYCTASAPPYLESFPSVTVTNYVAAP